MLSLLRGEGQYGPARVDLSAEQPCVMCSAPASRGEIVHVDGQAHQVGWCLACWLRRSEGVPPVEVVA
jgi:hypothetical protein